MIEVNANLLEVFLFIFYQICNNSFNCGNRIIFRYLRPCGNSLEKMKDVSYKKMNLQQNGLAMLNQSVISSNNQMKQRKISHTATYLKHHQQDK